MATPINILVNGQSLLEYFDRVSIQFTEDSFCNAIDISIKDKQLWDLFDPIANFGVLKIQVLLGDMTYEFLTEERSTQIPESGIEFTVWGRSAQALLDAPYSKWVNDEEEKVHPWQLGDCRVSEIITYVLNYCCSDYIRSKVAIHWNVEDFIVYKDTFSTSHSFPIGIISTLATIIGAEFIANADGSLTIQEYSVAEETSIQEYNDLDHIVSLNDEIVYPVGYNSVTVNGYGADTTQNTPYLSAELLEQTDGESNGGIRIARCYHYHPQNLGVVAFAANATVGSGRSNQISITEWVVLTWGSGTTQHVSSSGVSNVEGNTQIPIVIQSVTYSCNYTDFSVSCSAGQDDEPPYGIVAFYFTDGSNITTISLSDDADSSESDQTEVQLDWDEQETANEPVPVNSATGKSSLYIVTFGRPNNGNDESGIMLNTSVPNTSQVTVPKVVSKDVPLTLNFRVWGDVSKVSRYFDSQYNVLHVTSPGSYPVSEEIVFVNGEGSLSRPYYRSGSVHWLTPGGSIISFKKHSTSVKIKSTTLRPFACGMVSYDSQVARGHATIPRSYTASQFYVLAQLEAVMGSDGQLQTPELLSISHAITNEDLGEGNVKNVAISVKDFATDVVIAGASIRVDGVFRGTTDGDGVLVVNDLMVGDHQILITASGYLDSDEDELANDTFTVS